MADGGGLVARFAYADDMLHALRGLVKEGHRIETVFSPLPLPEVEEILEERRSGIRFVVLAGGICGALSMVGLAVYAHLSFSLITSGKPVLPWIPWVIVAFEGTVLGAVVSAVVAWVVEGHLPRPALAKGYDGSFSQDRFGILVHCVGSEEEKARHLLEEAGAEEVRRVDR